MALGSETRSGSRVLWKNHWIEQGQTAHGRVMGQAVINAILNLQLDLMKPIGVGILGPEIQPDQIQERLVPYARDAVLAVHAMLGSPSNSS